jgi:hypothetical protein
VHSQFSPKSWQNNAETFSVRIEAGPDVISDSNPPSPSAAETPGAHAVQLEINEQPHVRVLKVGKYKCAGQAEDSDLSYGGAISNEEDSFISSRGLREISANESFMSAQSMLQDDSSRITLPHLKAGRSLQFNSFLMTSGQQRCGLATLPPLSAAIRNSCCLPILPSPLFASHAGAKKGSKAGMHIEIMTAKLKVAGRNKMPRHKVPRLLAPVKTEHDKHVAALLDRDFD